MSYADVVAGLKERIETVDGLNAVLGYEPTSIDPPMVYILLDGFNRQLAGGVTRVEYRVLARLCIRWQDFEEAEQELIPFVNSIPAAIEASMTLGGHIERGAAQVTEGLSGFTIIGGVEYRIIDFFATVVEKGPRGGGL